MDARLSHWDPFGRHVAAQVHQVPPVALPVRVPPAAVSALTLVALGASVPMLLMALFGSPWAWVPAGVFALAIAAVLGASMLDKTEQRRLHTYMQLAEQLNWSFRLAPKQVPGGPGLSGSRRRSAAGLDIPADRMPGALAGALQQAEAAQRAAGTLSDTDPAELLQVYRSLPELFSPRPGQPVAMTIEAEFWGETAAGLPFWLGAREALMDTTFASPELRQDRHGNRGRQGALLMMVAGYGLDRDTGIRAVLTAEALGDAAGDYKTESAAFNERFHIAARGDAQLPDDVELRLLQALTPATQMALLELWDRYRIQVIIDGATVFVSGYERLNTRNEAVLRERLPAAAEAFAAAAIRFKRYVE